MEQVNLSTDELSVILKSLNDLTLNVKKEDFNKCFLDIYLKLAYDLNQSDFLKFAREIEEIIIEKMYCDSYRYDLAYSHHKRRFAQRHIMANFLIENLDLIKSKVDEYSFKIEENKRDKIFVYWNSKEHTPVIIEKCHDNLLNNIDLSKFEVIFLNRDNYKNYIEIDKNVLNLLENEVQFSDLLRLELLRKFGGFWLDATCLITKDFYEATKHITKNECFLYKYSKARIGNWFIWSKPNNYIISMVSEAYKLWWLKKGFLTNYFMMHDVFEMLYWVDLNYQEQWDKIESISILNAIQLFKKRHENYNQIDFFNIIDKSFIHKLTYKRIDKLLTRNSNMKAVMDHY